MKLHALPCAALVALHCVGAVFAAGDGWTSDFEAAKKQAAEQKKDVLIDFTGSDWCPDCVVFDREILNTSAFTAGAKDKFVLVKIDFPQDETKLDEATRKQNEALDQRFQIEQFPTVFLTDAEGKPFAKTGYQEGGPAKYLEHLDSLRAKKTKRDEAFAAAAKAEGVEQAKQYVTALKAMELGDRAATTFYADVVDKIKKADPNDETGFAKQLEMQAQLVKFEEQLNTYGEKNDPAGAFQFVDQTLKEGRFEGVPKQQITLTKALILVQLKKYDDAIKTLDEVKAIAPDSEIGKEADGMKQDIEEMKKNPPGDVGTDHSGEDAGAEKPTSPAQSAPEEKK